MIDSQISDLNFFIFLIPGFIMIWCFRKFTDKKLKNDFELVGLSTFCGLINLLLWEIAMKEKTTAQLLQNPYAATFLLCVFAAFLAYIGSWIAQQKWWLCLKNRLKPKPVKFIKWLKG